jgi:hypothetical protein
VVLSLQADRVQELTAVLICGLSDIAPASMRMPAGDGKRISQQCTVIQQAINQWQRIR